MPRVFISYRRSDSADATGRIYDQLCGRFPPNHVFKDVDSMPLGVDFIEHIAAAIRTCHVVLVIIGSRWLDTSTPNGRPRIHDPEDVVRRELESALSSNVKVIPVLVQGAQMPSSHELPDALKPLCHLSAATVRSGRDFRKDMEGLYRAISTPSHVKRWLSVAIVTCALCFISVLYFSRAPSPDGPTEGQGMGHTAQGLAAGPNDPTEITEQLLRAGVPPATCWTAPPLHIDDVLVNKRQSHVELDVRIRNSGPATVNVTRADVHIRERMPYAGSYHASATYDLLIEGEHNVVAVAHALQPGEVDRFLLRLGFTSFNTSCGFEAELILQYNDGQTVASRRFRFFSEF